MNEERIKELLKNTGREGIDDLISYMEENGFFTSPYKNHINGYPSGSTPAGDGFMNIPDGIDEELPFN